MEQINNVTHKLGRVRRSDVELMLTHVEETTDLNSIQSLKAIKCFGK